MTGGRAPAPMGIRRLTAALGAEVTGVDLAEVSRVLEGEGVAAFVASFDDLLADLGAKAATF